MILCGSISCCGTIFVISFYWTNKSLQRSIYNTVIYYISISDFFSSLGGALGYVRESSPLCEVQAVLTNIFPLSSVFWVTILIYIYVKLLTSHESIHLIHSTIHVFCWGFPILLTFLPLTTNRFGVLGGEIGWCWLDERSDTPPWASFFWNVVSFYLWIWIAISVYLLFYFYILYEIRNRYDTFRSSDNILRTLHKISLYPISVVCCWLIPCIYDLLDYYQSSRGSTTHNLIFEVLSSVTPMLQGLFTCLIFVSTNSEVVSTSMNQLSQKYFFFLQRSSTHDPSNMGSLEFETSAQISSSRISSIRLPNYPSPGADSNRGEVTANPLGHRLYS
jgi:hypothetical protein